jgi:O-antigen/teichoic acid export membrane protein
MVARIVRLLGALALLPLAIVVLFGPRMFAFAFGAEWRTAGEYGRLLMPAIAVWFVASPLTLVPTATGRQDVLLRFIMASAVLRLGGLAIGLSMGAPSLAVALLGGAEALVGIGFVWWVYRAAVTGRLVSA